MSLAPSERMRRHARARTILMGALLLLAGLLVLLALVDLDRARVRSALQKLLPGVQTFAGVEEAAFGAFVAAGLLVLCAAAVRRGERRIRVPLGVLLLLPPASWLLAELLGGAAPLRWLAAPLAVGKTSGPLAIWLPWLAGLGVYVHAWIHDAFTRTPPPPRTVGEVFE
ncbi:MAG: hypothetical protein QNJ98_04450 [Planctomycetota bacterium]|nr:hypothetical protein [Planctomycetota bacterium]